jgi:hypothetical protein
MPVPSDHRVRKVLLGITGLVGMFMFLVFGGFALTTSSSTSIGAWRDGGGLDRLTALSKDLAATEHAAQAADVAGVSTACRSLQSDTEAAQAYAPIPDAEAQAHWAAALAHLARASTNCVAAIRDRDSALFVQASEELAVVPADVSQVINRLVTLSH